MFCPSFNIQFESRRHFGEKICVLSFEFLKTMCHDDALQDINSYFRLFVKLFGQSKN